VTALRQAYPRSSVPLVAFLGSLAPVALAAQAPPADTVLEVVEVAFDTARLGENTLRATIRNAGTMPVTAVMDLRAVPGMWMIPNIQRQTAVELAPGEGRVVEGTYAFQRMSLEATLRLRVGPGSRTEHGSYRVDRVDFEATYPVGADSPDAFDPADWFALTRRGPLEIYAWKRSPAERDVDAIASQRLGALEALEKLLDVPGPPRIRLVFYADEATKIEQTGHHGVGWATGTTIVEVYSDDVRLDPYHELAHVVAGDLGSPPSALAEGFAIYASEHLGADALEFLGYGGRSSDDVVCALAGTSDFIPLEDLLTADIGSDRTRSGREYAEAGSFVKYLIEGLGAERFRRAYTTLDGEARPAENLTSLRDLFGMDADLLQTGWLGRACAPQP